MPAATITYPRRDEKKTKRGRPEATERLGTGRWVDLTISSKIEVSGT
jgi:hypothetical protein